VQTCSFSEFAEKVTCPAALPGPIITTFQQSAEFSVSGAFRFSELAYTAR
jgi:hypothetical protein